MAKHILLSFVSLLVVSVLNAQTTIIFEENLPVNIDSKLQPELKNLNRNKVIEILALAEGQPSKNVQLTINFKLYNKITRGDRRVIITSEIGNFIINGDHVYKGFNINKFLQPDVINFTWTLTDNNGNVIDKKEVKNAKFSLKEELLKMHRNDTLNNNNLKLAISSISFDYSRDQFAKLDDYIALVDGYYNADARLKLMENELAVVRIDTLELLEQNRQLTIDNVAVINKIKAERYSSKLDLETYDPIGLMSHIGKADQKNREVKKQVETTLDNMHVAYYYKGMDWLNWNNKAKARELFVRSLKVKATYTPPIYQLALMDFESRKYKAVLDSCQKINSKLKPDTDTRYNTVKLAENVLTIYIDSIRQLISLNDIDNSFKLLETSIDYAKRIDGVKTFEAFDLLYGQLYATVYNNLVGQARLLVESGKLDEAHIFADSAGQLRLMHPQYEINPEKENGVMNKLYKAWIDKGKAANEVNKPEEALYAFDKATAICRKYKAVPCTDELNALALKSHSDKYAQLIEAVKPVLAESYADSALQLLTGAETYRLKWELVVLPDAEKFRINAYQIKYDGSIVEGDRALKSQKSREAIAFYKAALEFTKAAPVKINPEWNNKYLSANKLFIIQACNQGVSYAEVMQMGKAGQQHEIALAVANENNLMTDAEIKKALDELAAALDQGECSKAWNDYNIQMGSAMRLINQKEFLKAQLALERATNLAKVNFKCHLTDTASTRKASEIAAICKYQRLSDKVNPTLEQKGFGKAIEYYSAAYQFLSDSCPNKFGIEPKPLLDFIFTSQYSGLLENGVQYYTKLGETKNAMKLLEELYRRNFEPAWAKDCQIQLGIELAHADMQRNPDADPKLKVLEYTRGDKWFNNLKKAYLQEWKNR